MSGTQRAYSLAATPPLTMPPSRPPVASPNSFGPAFTDAEALSEVGHEQVVHEIDDFDLPAFTDVAANYGQERYGYVVTPNVDHLIRYHEDPAFRTKYLGADYILMDSRFAARLVKILKGVRLPICTGSDLTANLFAKVLRQTDRLVIIGGSEEQAQQIGKRYGLTNLKHHNPPMGFINDPRAVEDCLRFIEAASPFRFCFLALGCPQQETIAQGLRARGVARGLALCVGASLNFITGHEKRAPVWVQKLELEWLFRLAHNPKRLAHRYLIRGPRIFAYLRRSQILLRKT